MSGVERLMIYTHLFHYGFKAETLDLLNPTNLKILAKNYGIVLNK